MHPPPPPPRRWDNLYEATDLADLPHRRLTKPCKVLEHFFDGERRGKTRCGAGATAAGAAALGGPSRGLRRAACNVGVSMVWLLAVARDDHLLHSHLSGTPPPPPKQAGRAC
jgi:hypothetical protein